MSWLAKFALKSLLPGGGALPGIEETDLDGFLARMKAEAPFLLRASLSGGALVFALTPPITIGVPLPAFWLSPAALERHMNRLSDHPVYLLRQVMVAIKTMAGLCWGADPVVRGALGLPVYPADPGTWKGTTVEVGA